MATTFHTTRLGTFRRTIHRDGSGHIGFIPHSGRISDAHLQAGHRRVTVYSGVPGQHYPIWRGNPARPKKGPPRTWRI